MKKFVVRPEPEVTARLIDSEAAQLFELLPEHKRIPRRSSTSVDVGRSVFYMLAIDGYIDYIRNHPLTDDIVRHRKEELRPILEDPNYDWSQRKPWPRAKLPYEEGSNVIALDELRFEQVCGIAIIEQTAWDKALLHGAVHYFQSRAT